MQPLIKANRVLKYSITYQETDEDSREVSDFLDSGFIIENETDEIGNILKLAVETYGIYYPVAFGWWESTYPVQNKDYFEKGIEIYYALHITNEDGTEITQNESDFITFLLSDGNYNKDEFTEYAVGGIVLGALALGIGGLIAYYYFNKGKGRNYPTGRAWTKEHYNDNDDEDYEVSPNERNIKHKARNRQFDNGGMVGSEIEFNKYGEQRTGTIYEDFGDNTYAVQSGTGKMLVDKSDITRTLEPKKETSFSFFDDGGGVENKIQLKNFSDLKQGDVIRRKERLGTTIFVVNKSPVQSRIYKNEYDALVTCIVSNTNFYKPLEEYYITSVIKYGKLGNVDYLGKWNYNDKIDYSIYLPKSNKKYDNGGGVETNFEIVVVAKGLEKDGGQIIKDRYYINSVSENEAKNIAEEMWKEDMDNSDFHIIDILTDIEYRNKYLSKKLDNGGGVENAEMPMRERTTITRPTTTPTTTPSKPDKKNPYKPKHIPKPKARK
jgi:hypothetical protein